jgi:hypothetical protein
MQSIGANHFRGESMIRKSMPSDSIWGDTGLPLATNAKRVCVEVMLKQKERA